MANKSKPERMCVGCREMKQKRSLIRVVKTPEGEIKIDGSGKMSGRGAYICRDMECLQKAVKSRGLERSLKIAISDEIKTELMTMLAALPKEAGDINE
ncbi:MAG: RNase P modulator RnpM [Bacillota bacterium]